MSRGLVIIGATGFVGAAILRRLPSCSFSPVHILARDPGKLPRDLPSQYRIFNGELAAPSPNLFPEADFSLIHMATKQIDSDGSGFEANNVAGTSLLLESLPPSARTVVYGSSASVYGQGAKSGVTEHAPPRPETPLALSRLAAEQLILSTASVRAFSAYCLRPRFLFGVGDRHTLPGLTRMVRYGVQPGDGSQVHSVINVDDYAAIVLTLASRNGPPERMSLNTAYRNPLAFQRLIQFICGRSGLPSPRVRVPVREGFTRLLRRTPFDAARSLAVRLELFGLSQWLDTSLLASVIGESIVGQSPIRALEGAA